MKKIIVSIIILFSLNFKAISHVQHYDDFNYLEYELFRNNESIGYHKYDFLRDGDNLSIVSEVSFKITKLGVDLYEYFAKSEENYKKGVFKSYFSKTKQNKKDRYVNISVDDEKKHLIIDGSSYIGEASTDCIIGNWWNHKILEANKQISPLTGSIKNQVVQLIGKENIIINGKSYDTYHYKLKSKDDNLPKNKKLDFDIWVNTKNNLIIKVSYSRMGNWEYRLKSFKIN